MRSMMPLVVCVALGAALAYTAGAGHAKADAWACLVRTNYRLGCEDCAGYLCDPCDDGTCPGSIKICQLNFDVISQLYTPGYQNSMPTTAPCFVVYPCAPDDPQSPCSVNNPCGMSETGQGQLSLSRFATYALWGDCPGPEVDPNST